MSVRNKQSSHKHKKLNKYTASVGKRKRKKHFSLWWLVPICALAAFIIAVALGHFLGEIAESSKSENSESLSGSDKETSGTPVLPTEPEKLDVNSINAIFVGLEGIHDMTASNIAAQIPEGTKAISLSMFTQSHNPMYESKVAKAFGQYCGELTLKNIFVTMNEKDIYVSVPFPSKALSNSDQAKQDVMNAYEVSLIRELYDYGADEIIIKATDFGKSAKDLISDEKFISKLAFYISEIKLKMPDLRIGFMLSAEEVMVNDYGKAIDDICKYADFCAVDFTSFGKSESKEEFEKALESSAVAILKNNMRILIGAANEKDLLSFTESLDLFKMNNRQIVKPFTK